MNKKILRWNFIFQYGWIITNVFNSILLFPIYLKHIDKDTLGLWVATSSIISWITLVYPGVGEVLQQKIAEMRGRTQKVLPGDLLTKDSSTNTLAITNEQLEIGKSIGSGFIASAIILLLSVIIGLIFFLWVR